MPVPRGAAPQALLGVLALIVVLALALVPVVDARPKDKREGKQDEVASETVPPEEPAPADAVVAEPAPAAEPIPVVEQPLTATEGNTSNDRSLIQLDADGDYIPDALDNCPNVQNPGQADGNGDGNGDDCPVLLDTDGDTVPDQQDNCPTVATSDYSDNDGDGVGNPCDKSPDGVEPEPEPLPDLDGQGGEEGIEAPAPENGEGLHGEEVERSGRSRSKQRSRTDISRPVITTGSEGTDEGVGGPPAQEEPSAEEPVRDNPRRNEELIAEAAASGELYAPPEPPPVPQRAWDEEAAGTIDWESIVRIDAGATGDEGQAGQTEDDEEPNDAGRARGGDGREPRDAGDEDVGDSEFARGWVRAKLLLQDEIEGDAADEESDTGEQRAGTSPVPVENGLVIDGSGGDETGRDRDAVAQSDADDEPLDEPEQQDEAEPLDEPERQDEPRESTSGRQQENDRGERRDGSRRDGSSRSAAAPADRQRPAAASGENDDQGNETRERKRRNRRERANGGIPAGWSDDRYFSRGSALNWSGDIGVAGTDDDGLYLTQRSGSGPGKRRGFDYAIPVDGEGIYQVRLYFAEPYWGAPGGPEGEEGRRVFTVTGEVEALLEDFDVYAEAGAVTALVKQVEVEVTDGELNLRFTASEGEPIVAAIEVLQPSHTESG
jgi:hypothetical protein